MIAPNISERVLAGWDEALDARPGSLFRPSSSLEDAVTNVTANLLDHRFFDRWTCDNEDCPARPAWDHALDETFGRITANAQESMLEAFRAILIRELEAFAKAHPEAAWRPVGKLPEGSADNEVIGVLDEMTLA